MYRVPGTPGIGRQRTGLHNTPWALPKTRSVPQRPTPAGAELLGDVRAACGPSRCDVQVLWLATRSCPDDRLHGTCPSIWTAQCALSQGPAGSQLCTAVFKRPVHCHAHRRPQSIRPAQKSRQGALQRPVLDLLHQEACARGPGKASGTRDTGPCGS